VTTTALLTAEDLLAGKDALFDVEVPAEVLRPADEHEGAGDAVVGGHVTLRPLTVSDVQLIAQAAKDDEVLTSVLMIRRAVVEPKLEQADAAAMHGGLVGFLVGEINRISGLRSTDEDLRALAASPLAQAFMVLAREFNWTPAQLRAMTLGEVLAYLEMTREARERG
jgi:hypothetical protein